MKSCPIDQIELHPAFERLPRPQITPQLLNHIQSFGIISPLLVRAHQKEAYQLLNQRHIFYAAGLLEIHNVPVLLSDVSAEQADEYVRANDLSSQLNPIEEAEWLQSQIYLLQQTGKTRGAAAQLARKLSVSRAYVSSALKLLTLPESVKELIRKHKISGGHAKALFRLRDQRQQKIAAKYILKHQLSVREAERYCTNLATGLEPQEPDVKVSVNTKSADIIRFEREISEKLGCPFSLKSDGTATINYFDDLDILDGVISRLNIKP